MSLWNLWLLLLQFLFVLIQLNKVVLQGNQPNAHQLQAQEEEFRDRTELSLDLHLLCTLLALVDRFVLACQRSFLEDVVLRVDALVFLSLLRQKRLTQAQHHHVRVQHQAIV